MPSRDRRQRLATLGVTPVFLVLVVAITIGAALLRLSGGLDRRPSVWPGAVVGVLGGLAALLILIRIVFPPDLGGEFAGFTFETTLKAGVFLALVAACGIAYGGYRSVREREVRIHGAAPMSVAAVAVLLLAGGCGESSPPETSNSVKGREAGALEWGFKFAPSSRVAMVGGGAGYCEGDPKPRIAKPDIQYRGDDVYIRLELRTPRHRPADNGLCFGVGLPVTRRITLRRDLSELNLYDSGVDPPELRWPD